jgi:hypothetical protein
MRGAAAIITRLRQEGRLHPSWTTAEAATLLWELTSFRVWDDLVNESGLAPDRYVAIVTAAALAALASPLSEQPDSSSPPPGHDAAVICTRQSSRCRRHAHSATHAEFRRLGWRNG